MTNSHVVGEAERVTVRFDDSGQEVPAPGARHRPVVRSGGAGREPLRHGVAAAAGLARSSSVRVGDEVVAIGFPLGLDKTATEGIVSGLERDIQAPNGFQIDRVIQTDAPINPGNSGGPLLDTRGRVVGVNSQIATAGAGERQHRDRVAVPADAVRTVLPRLKAGERIERPFIGLTSSADPRGGARVRDVTRGGPADQAGMSAAGDVIVGIDGRPVRDPGDVSAAVARAQARRLGPCDPPARQRPAHGPGPPDHAARAAARRPVDFGAPWYLVALLLVPLAVAAYLVLGPPPAQGRRRVRRARHAAVGGDHPPRMAPPRADGGVRAGADRPGAGLRPPRAHGGRARRPRGGGAGHRPLQLDAGRRRAPEPDHRGTPGRQALPGRRALRGEEWAAWPSTTASRGSRARRLERAAPCASPIDALAAEGGTATGEAIAAVDALAASGRAAPRGKNPAAIILLSDGFSTQRP